MLKIDILQHEIDTGAPHWLSPQVRLKDKIDAIRKKHRDAWLKRRKPSKKPVVKDGWTVPSFARDAEFKEENVKRDDDGKFAEQAGGGAGAPAGPARFKPPKKTITAYKLFETKPGQPGKLFPLFINKNQEVPIGEWVPGEAHPTKGYSPEHPGQHAGVLPTAKHLRSTHTGKIQPDRVWAEVELPADTEYKWDEVHNRVPEGGFYRFKTSERQGGMWLIGGAVRVKRVLTDEDVADILRSHGRHEDAAAEMHEEASGPKQVRRAKKTAENKSEPAEPLPPTPPVGDTPEEAHKFATERLTRNGHREGRSRVREVQHRHVGLWGASHHGSTVITGYSARVMGIGGYRYTPLTKQAASLGDKFLDVIAEGQGAGEKIYHGFDNTEGITFNEGDTIKLPLTATAGDIDHSHGYAIHYSRTDEENSGATVFEFPAYTPIAGYARWDREATKEFGHTWTEAITAGEFRVGKTRIEHEFGWRNLPFKVVTLEPTAIFDRASGTWKKL